MFNAIELRGIRREEQKPASSIMGSRKQPLLGMERNMIHYNHCTLVKGRQKLICVNAAFIHISNLFWRYIFDLFLIRCCFLLILLLIAGCLFSLVNLYR